MKKIKILIRFDDICPTMNWELWNKAYELLDQYDVKPLIGVIPACEDPDLLLDTPRMDFWDYIRNLQRKGYTIAMHGYQHVFVSNHKGVVNNRVGSEFAGLSYEEQYEKINKGKQIFDENGIITDIFFAPAHSYDMNTLKAIKANGFRYISDGKSTKPVEKNGIICIPCRSSGCPIIGRSGYYTAVFHAHEWDRPDKAYGYDQLVDLLKGHGDSVADFGKYATRDFGNYTFQAISERLYVFYEYKINSKMMLLKHTLKSYYMRFRLKQ